MYRTRARTHDYGSVRHYERGQCRTQRGLFLFSTWRATCRPMSALTTRRRERWCHRSRWMVIERWYLTMTFGNIMWHIGMMGKWCWYVRKYSPTKSFRIDLLQIFAMIFNIFLKLKLGFILIFLKSIVFIYGPTIVSFWI